MWIVSQQLGCTRPKVDSEAGGGIILYLLGSSSFTTCWFQPLAFVCFVISVTYFSWIVCISCAVCYLCTTSTHLCAVNPLNSKGNYSGTSNNTKLVHWPLMGGLLHLVQRGGAWAGCSPAKSPPRCTKCNSPPINGQCTNHCVAVWRSVALRFWCGD